MSDIEWIVDDVEHAGEYKLILTFRDGKRKLIDLQDELWGELFDPLRDVEYFKKVSTEGTSICWPNGADFAPEFLYEKGVEVPVRKMSSDR